ncbi:MAG TPA: CAP domain-containing protein [Anaerolineaceae bacterium]
MKSSLSRCLVAFVLLSLAFPVPVDAATQLNGKIFLPLVAAAQTQPDPAPARLPPVGSGWLARVNAYRTAAHLPALTENTTWSDGDLKHARYTVGNGVLGHTEDSSKPYYTPEGAAAAGSSNVMASSSSTATDESAIDMWMQGPFHALGILDPRLSVTGFGSFRDAKAAGSPHMAAALDVIRGNGALPAGFSYPVMWPGSGATVSLSSYTGGESPNPLSKCSGYSIPTGLPIILQVGSGSSTPQVSAHSFSQGTTPLEHCLYDETSFPAGSTETSILAWRNAIVLIPRAPLTPGKTYSVSITDRGTRYNWSFTIGN